MMFGPDIPQWVFAVGAGVPDFVIGVLLLVYRKPIARTITSLTPQLESAASWLPRGIVIGGLFLMAVSTFLIVTSISSTFAG
ncbi:hypothetical protein [Schumannella luteola]|jgi:hypothetical protein